MKQTENSVWGGFHTPDCPAGCATCSAEKDRFAARFGRTRLTEGETLPEAHCRSHRILFLLTGRIHVRIGRNADYELTDRQCVFLARKKDVSVRALTDSEMVILDFNNRITLCHNDILAGIATRATSRKAFPPILPIVPEVLFFFRGLGPVLEPEGLHLPCYHVVKEYELFLMMRYFYGAEELGDFLRDVIRPKDDFRLFVLSTYHQAEHLNELAQMANMSESAFIRRFRETFGEPFHSWRVKQKAADIVQAIRDGIRSNDELIRLFRFKSYLAFYRFCQRHMHCSPSALKTKYS